MKIAMITSDYVPYIGGVASHIKNLSKAILDLGYDVEVWFWDIRNKAGDIDQSQIPTCFLKPKNFLIENLILWVLTSISLALEIKRHIKRFKPDVLHVHTVIPFTLGFRLLGRSRKYCKVLTNHTSMFLMNTQSLSLKQQIKLRICCGGFKGIIAPSQELLDRSKLLGVHETHMKYIPNGVDPRGFFPGDQNKAREILKLPHNKWILLSTRRIVRKNGIRYLAEALNYVKNHLNDFLCVFCGGPGASDKYELPLVNKIIKDHGLQGNVRFEGDIPNKEIKTYIDACDIAILPSLMEATSISGLEAMACGKPLIGTRVGGIPDLIEHEVTGLLTEPADSKALADTIIKMINTCDLEKMGKAARIRILERFEWEKIAQDTLSFYSSLLK